MTELSFRQEAIARFAGRNAGYYISAFGNIGEQRGYVASFNILAALFGPIWLAGRRIWSAFWPILIAELLAILLIGFGLSGGSGTDLSARADRLEALAISRSAEAKTASDKDSASSIAVALTRSAEALDKAAKDARLVAEDAGAGATMLSLAGAGLLLLSHMFVGSIANHLAERRFRRWRLASESIGSGFSWIHASASTALLAVLVPIIIISFHDATLFSSVPSNPEINSSTAAWLDSEIGRVSSTIAPAATILTASIGVTLDVMEGILTKTPWPVVMALVAAIAWQLAGFRVFLLTLVAISYLAILGFWEKSMQTIALLGTAALISIAIGIPLGVLCGYNRRIASLFRPVLDLMQTMPAFVYLIPVIALFGIGKPSGIIATTIFGIPPVVRLTALGISSVPSSVREAAIAFGASRTFVLFKIDLPTAAPSIMAGVSQTILMCLSMVVIAALIGAKGLGEDVLHALQYAAQGQGLLAGVAILLCAIVLDRVVQGQRRS
jgi:glycine betaine/proline transport system permease protein